MKKCNFFVRIIKKTRIGFHIKKFIWRKKNKHNFTRMGNEFDGNIVNVGRYTYGTLNVLQFGNPVEKLDIGNFCSIAEESFFLTGGEHGYATISTYPYKVMCNNEISEAISKGPIVVKDDVWIGFRTTVMSGVTIGQGAVVAAGSVVTKDVPPYAIVAGVPAKVIKYRFSTEIIEELLKVDYSKMTDEMIKTHINDLYSELKGVSQIEWLPKK